MAVGYRDYYEALGVPRDASTDDIRRVYRKLAREFHPDVNKDPAAEGRFREVSEAYEVLRDPEKRERYDRLGANWRTGQDVSGSQGFGSEFGRGFGRGAAGGPGGPGGGHVEFGQGGDFGDFSDFFESLFGARRGGAGGRGAAGFRGFPAQGADHEAVLELSLEEAAAGGRKALTIGGRRYDVEIPAGVPEGRRIRLAGQGGPARTAAHPATCSCGCTWPRIPRSGSKDATCTSISR